MFDLNIKFTKFNALKKPFVCINWLKAFDYQNNIVIYKNVDIKNIFNFLRLPKNICLLSPI